MDASDVQAPFDPREFDIILATSLRDTERTAPDRLLLTFAPTAESAVREVARRMEKGLDVRVEDGQLLAEISVPASETDLLDMLVLRAATAEQRVLRHFLDEELPRPRPATR